MYAHSANSTFRPSNSTASCSLVGWRRLQGSRAMFSSPVLSRSISLRVMSKRGMQRLQALSIGAAVVSLSDC
ncbi:hypothetical protein L209DRAFT_751639 [Thermothelomyces heterothallicus CBS 203.75]